MEDNYRASVYKWIPSTSIAINKYFMDSLTFSETMNKLLHGIALKIKKKMDLNKLIIKLESIVPELRKILYEFSPQNFIFEYKFKRSLFSLQKYKNIVGRFIKNLIKTIINFKNEENFIIIFRLVNVYNELLELNESACNSSLIIFYNDSPNNLSEKKLSVGVILQILANNQVEEFSLALLDYLLSNYQETCNKDDVRFTTFNNVDFSENSSIEIYRTLTKHINSNIVNVVAKQKADCNTKNIQMLLKIQTKQMIRFLNIMKIISPNLFKLEVTQINNDEINIRSIITQLIEFYQGVIWHLVSTILDHVILWWSLKPLAGQHFYKSKHLNEWLREFLRRCDVPLTAIPVLYNLSYALGCHMTIIIWDQVFRLAYTTGFKCQSKTSSEGTDTGQKFIKVLHFLMTLNNEYNMNEKRVDTPLIEYPLYEQIIVLHRMDHSIHIMRLWVMQEARLIAHTWELKIFFLLVKRDVFKCINVLSYLKFADYTNKLEREPISIHIYVCTKMRAKIFSEVLMNMQLLNNAPAICINILAKIGRTISFANLHVFFPESKYWKQNLTVAPSAPSVYVEIYFERVLFPVLKVIEDAEISNMILCIMCEAWLDYIYLYKIEFSKWGALQLLTDFTYVLTWVTNCSIISDKIRQQLLQNEVLRRCEGVGRLLLRHPGESISMTITVTKNESFESLGLGRMPAEMYVPNQKQWLELRAGKKYNVCCLE